MKFIILMSIFVCVSAQTKIQTCDQTKLLSPSEGYGTLKCDQRATAICKKMANVQCIGHAKPFETGYSYDWKCFNIPNDPTFLHWFSLNIEGPEHDVLSVSILPENMLMDFILSLILILIEAVIYYYAPRNIRNGLILLDFIYIIIYILSPEATLTAMIVS
jgi:hypothetical protein